jgi:hypothetical protein
MADLLVTMICPACGVATVEIMPIDRCVFFYECAGCRTVLRLRLAIFQRRARQAPEEARQVACRLCQVLTEAIYFRY